MKSEPENNTSALLVVDIQQFYMQDLPDDFAQRIVNHHQALSYDHIVFVTFRNQPGSPLVTSLKWTKCDTAEDAALLPEFSDLATRDNCFERAAYSGFKQTKLHEYLQNLNVSRLVICGVDTDACVLATAFDAFDLGYHTKVATDLTFSTGDLQNEAEKIIKRSIESRD